MSSDRILSLNTLPPVPILQPHNYEWVDLETSDAASESNAHLICSICTNLVFEPCNQPCGHLHCRSCLERVLGTSSRRAPCPICRTPFKRSRLDQLVPFAQRQIWQLKVKCPNSSNGCTWAGEMGTDHRHVQQHYQFCSFHSHQCRACKQGIWRKDVASHPDQCSERLVLCQECETVMTYRQWKDHRTPTRPGNPLPDGLCSNSTICPNRCELDGKISSVPSTKVREHLKTCPLRNEACDRCSERMLWSTIPDHANQRCSRREVSCNFCDQRMEFRKLAAHQDTSRSIDARLACGNLYLCANGCGQVLCRFKNNDLHKNTCSHRPVTCPCCTKVAHYLDLQAHVLTHLADASNHVNVANHLIHHHANKPPRRSWEPRHWISLPQAEHVIAESKVSLKRQREVKDLSPSQSALVTTTHTSEHEDDEVRESISKKLRHLKALACAARASASGPAACTRSAVTPMSPSVRFSQNPMPNK